MVTIQVVHKSTGKPVSGKRVVISFDGLRGNTDQKYSDNSGEVTFNVDPGRGTIYVNSENVFEGRVEGRKVVYI